MYTYTAVLHKQRQDKILAAVPALGTCVTSGDSISDAISQVIDAATLLLTQFEDDGHPIPPDTSEGSDIIGKADYTTLIVCDTELYREAILSAVA